jgi:hypothetical protein
MCAKPKMLVSRDLRFASKRRMMRGDADSHYLLVIVICANAAFGFMRQST